MNTGLSLSELLVIFALVLVFFGSKELPALIREIARFMARVRRYSDKLRRELDSETNPSELSDTPTTTSKKEQLRNQYLLVRKGIEPTIHKEMSERIYRHLKAMPQFVEASAVMVYVSVGKEVATRNAIADMLEIGKRVVVPFCVPGIRDIGLAEITDPEQDLSPGTLGIPEPRRELRGLFFKSDLKLVICPGVAFDKYGSRLGRGKSYYDNFLRELKGRTPLVGLAFNCQIIDGTLPFDYHDIAMDQIITENGLLLPSESSAQSSALAHSPAG